MNPSCISPSNSYGIISTIELNLSLLLLIHLHSFQLKNLDQHRERWTSLEKWIDRQRKVNKRFHAATRVDRAFAFFRLAFFPLPPRILIKKKKKREKEREAEGEKNRNRKVYLARYTLHLLVFVGHRRDTLQRGREKKRISMTKTSRCHS